MNCNGCYLDAKAVFQRCCTKVLRFVKAGLATQVHHRESDAQLSITALPDMRTQIPAPSLSNGSAHSPADIAFTESV